MKRTIRGGAVLVALALGVGRAGAQQDGPHGRPRVPIIVAMLDSGLALPPGYRILRRHGGGPDDVIELTANADAATFSAAVRRLMLVRRVTGDTATAAGEVRMRGGGMESASGGAFPLPWAGRVLSDLRAADRRRVPGLGRLRTVRIWLPAQRRTGEGGTRP
jgi:hypothetical protein